MANGDDWRTEIQLKDYADLSFETRELLRKNQHGIDQKVIGEADAWWGTGEILRTNPQLAADALYEVRDQSPTKPRVPIGERVQQIPQVVADGVQDGILSAKINYLNYQELTGELSPEEVLTQTQVFRSQMSDPDNLIDYGWGLEKLVETPANIAGQLIPAGVEGLRRAAVVGPGVGLLGAAVGGPAVGAAAALPAAGVGLASGIVERTTKEAMGASFKQLKEMELVIYRDVETGDIISEDDYRYRLRIDRRYDPDHGYPSEKVPMPLNIASGVAKASGAIIGAFELLQMGLAGARIAPGVMQKLFPTQKAARLFGERAIKQMIEDGSLLRFAQAKVGQSIVLGGQELGVEILQDITTEMSTRVAGDLAELATDANVPRGDREAMMTAVFNSAVNTIKEIGPGIMVLSAGGVALSSPGQYIAGRHSAKVANTKALNQADGSTAAYFSQTYGEDVPVGELKLPDEISEQKRIVARSLLKEVRANDIPTKFDPLGAIVRGDGSLFVEDPLAAALVVEARAAGLKTVRIARSDSARGPANAVPTWEAFSDSSVEAQISNQFPDLSVAEVKARLALLQVAAIRDNVSVTDWLDQHFPDGMIFTQTQPAPEPGAPPIPTLDGKLWNAPGEIADITEPTDAPIEPVPPPIQIVGDRQSKAIGRTLDMLRFNWQAGEWKTVSEWLEASGLENVVAAEELSLKLNADGSVPADAYAFALRSYLEEGPSVTAEEAVAEDTGETAVPAPDIDETSDEALRAKQMQTMRAVDGLRESIGSTMSSKTYLAGVEADAASAADAFLEQAAKNVAADLYDVTEGADRTAAEHSVLIDPLIEEERALLVTEDDNLRRTNDATLAKQAKKEQREAAMEADLEPEEAAAPEITKVADPEIDEQEIPYKEGEVERTYLIPAFDTRLSNRALPVIYQDMENRSYILSGIEEYNAAIARQNQLVKGTILRADAGVTIGEARAFATERARRTPDVPESTPVARTDKTERVVIKSDGEAVGAVQFDAMGAAMFEAFESSDYRSWIHGLASVFRRMLPAREEAIAARWAGVTSSRLVEGKYEWNWTPTAEYKFATGFEQYLREGRVRIPEMQPILKRLSEWTKASYAGNTARLSSKVRNVYEDLLLDEQSPSLKAFRQNIEKVGQVSDMLFQSPASRFTLRLKADEGRNLREIGENEADPEEGSPRTRVEALDESGTVVTVRHYSGPNQLDNAVKDISGFPTFEYPAPIGSSTFAPFRAKRTVSGEFYGPGPEGDPASTLSELGTEGTIYVGGKAVNEKDWIEAVIAELEEAGPLKQSGLVNVPTVKSWRRYPYVAELMANGVEGQLFQILSRDIDTGRAAEKGLRQEAQNMLREKFLSRGWTKDNIINITRDLDKPVEVKGWKHTRAKPTWTAGELLSFNRHLRIGQNREALLRDGFRDSPRKKPTADDKYGEIIKVDEDDIRAINKAVSELPDRYREFGTVIIDEVMDTIHERMDPVHKKSRGRSLGYVPYYWDLERKTSDVKNDAERSELEQDVDAVAFWKGRIDRPGEQLGLFTGMTKHRTKVSAPLVLRPLEFQLMRIIDRSSMYVGFEVPMKALRALFSNSRATDAMDRRMDRGSRVEIETTLSDVARRWSDGGEIDRLVKGLIRKVSIARLGGSPAVWLKQMLSIPLYNTYVPSKYLIAATVRGVPGGGQFQDMEARLRANDPTFVARSGGFDISLQGALEKSKVGQIWAKQGVGEFFMKPISFFDKRAVVIGSEASYMQVMDEFRTGKISEEVTRATGIRTRAEAMELGPDGMMSIGDKDAHWVTVRTQPNILPEQVSNFQRDRVGRVLSQFSGFTNVAYNLLARTRWRHKYDRSPKSGDQMRKAWLHYFIFNTAGVIVIDYLWAAAMGRAPEPEELPSWAGKKSVTSATGLIYVARDAMWWAMNPGYGPMSLPVYETFSTTVEAFYGVFDDLIQDQEISAGTMRKVAEAGGLLAGLPIGPYYRLGKRIYDVVDPLL